MASNVEIKARARNFSRQLALAARFLAETPEILHQEDTFFVVPHGRLKLRKFSPQRGQLIYYERTDQSGPKRSDYRIVPTSEPDSLRDVLASSLGVLGTVRKTRTVFVHENVRLHFDSVDGLGDFLEIEVVLSQDSGVREGEALVRQWMERLNIRPEDLIEGAYLDLLLQKRTSSA